MTKPDNSNVVTALVQVVHQFKHDAEVFQALGAAFARAGVDIHDPEFQGVAAPVDGSVAS